ncbi:hypothetical protein CFI10_07050 [Marinobacterium iners]|uniref:DUF2793 domain-containing protein n=1 Tax=Marinobacterium iners TaxID=48076 RepID=UPI001A8DAEBF|nr:DUF2793 domain-containing protein [Marinobacterium iners]QSR34754.1 hypothetical protein CFI10_07050 [Marinobacterium iners]
MPAIQGPNLGLNYGWTLGESGWNTGMDANLKKLDALIQLTVLSATSSVPASPTSGDRYIVPAGATGAWAGQDGKIARYNVDTWEFFTASAGWVAQVLNTGHRLRFSGSAWAAPEEVVVLETGSLIKDYAETVNATSGATLDRSTGGIQRLNLGANTTLDLSDLAAGQSVMYRVTGGATYTLSYTGLGAWSDGNVPTLSAIHYLEFVHDGVEVVGFDCGGR